MKKKSNENVIDELVVEKRRELMDRLRNKFPEADNVVVKTESDDQKVVINLSTDAYNSAIDKINEISKLISSGKGKSVKMRPNIDNSGFYLKCASLDNLLAIFQE